jgi:transposase
MAPLARRSWSVRGRPPLLRQKANHREKVSVAAALWLTPRRDRLGLAFQTLANGYFRSEEVAEFVGGAAPGLGGPVVVIWDRGNMHKGSPIRDVVRDAAGLLDVEPLPAHAWDLMPVEQLWTWLKYSRLCNFAPEDAGQLETAILRELGVIRDDQQRLRSFFHASDLPLPRTLLT